MVAVQDAGVDVGGRVDLGVIEEEEDGAEDALGTLEGGPALAGLLARHAVFAGGVEDRDAEAAIGVDVRVGDWDEEAELGWGVGVVVGKDHLGAEVAAVEGAVRVDDHEGEPPLEEVGRVVLCWATRVSHSLGDRSGKRGDCQLTSSKLIQFSLRRVFNSDMSRVLAPVGMVVRDMAGSCDCGSRGEMGETAEGEWREERRRGGERVLVGGEEILPTG